MKWKEFKETVEKEIKLIRPEMNVDEMEVGRIDIISCTKEALNVGTYLNNELSITDC